MNPNQKYLVAGRTGSGKSAVCRELAKRGINSIDTDSVDGLASWIEVSTGLPAQIDSSKEYDVDAYDWVWNEAKLDEILSKPGELFLCGSSSNDLQFFNKFDKVFVLKIDPETQLKRVLSRKEHDFGKHPNLHQKIVVWQKDFQKDALALGAIEINSDQPIDKVVDQILAKANEA